MPPEICPQCGALVPPDARACPECGSDEETGWSERAYCQRLGLPDEEFDYEEFVRDEFGPQNQRRSPGWLKWLWWFVALLLLVALSVYLLSL